ncbi:hypothetical protein D3C86_1920100 [compost metagenome]
MGQGRAGNADAFLQLAEVEPVRAAAHQRAEDLQAQRIAQRLEARCDFIEFHGAENRQATSGMQPYN